MNDPSEQMVETLELLPPWLQPAFAAISAMRQGGRLPHALLLQCPLGWGEERLASLVVTDLLNLSPRLDAQQLAHPDLHWLARDPGALLYKVVQLREALAFMQRTAQSGANKIIVVPAAQCMNAEGANTLLKSLEEPPPGGHWLLLCNEPAQLLATIRSRCQVLTVTPSPSDPAIAPYIRELLGDLQPNATELAMLSFEFGGAPEAVVAALHAEEEPLWPLLQAVLDDKRLISSVAERWQARDTAALLGAWLRYLHGLAAQSSPDYVQLQHGHQSEQLFRLADDLRQARALAARHSGVNVRLLLERLLFRWVTALT